MISVYLWKMLRFAVSLTISVCRCFFDSGGASLYLIEVSRVNVVNLGRASSLWLCDVKSSCCLTHSPPCLEWLHPGVDKAWNGGGSGTVAKGLFPLSKAHIDFHFEANSVTSPLCHSFAVYFAPLIPWAGWYEKSIAWKWMELTGGIIFCTFFKLIFITTFKMNYFVNRDDQ